MKQTIIVTLLAVLLPVLSMSVFAHGDEHGKNKAAAVKKEQKSWGVAGNVKAAKRTISIAMTDNMRFVPDKIVVKRGETIRLSLRNEGKMLHEMVIGTKAVLDEHAALMLKFPDMEHDEPYMVHVPAGMTGEIVWTFNRTGEFEFACLIPGHYQAGMVGRISVTAK
jgi:uncharacterized cupredoxin-like copper-binding protein